jgi:hypothetical protein
MVEYLFNLPNPAPHGRGVARPHDKPQGDRWKHIALCVLDEPVALDGNGAAARDLENQEEMAHQQELPWLS